MYSNMKQCDMSEDQPSGGRFSMDSQSVNAGVVSVSPVVFNLDLHVRKNTVVSILEGETHTKQIQ